MFEQARCEQMLARLQSIAKPLGVSVRQKGSAMIGHYQLEGKLLVNYYPFSKKSVAYVSGTTKVVSRVTPEQAVAMAVQPPSIVDQDDRARRKRHKYKRIKAKKFLKDRRCHWCHLEMDYMEVTIDHVIPLMRGGLDNENNMVIAHAKCNQERGADMPEIKGEKVSPMSELSEPATA